MADTETTTEAQEPSLAAQLRAARSPREEIPAPSTTEEQAPHSTDAKPASAPPWGDDFNPERAWNTIQAQREENRELKAREATREREKMSELERAQAELAEARQQIEGLQRESLRSQVAAAKGLPASALAFLHGENQRELEENADALLKLIGETPQGPPDFGNGVRPQKDMDTDDFSSVLRRAAGRPG